MLTHPRLATLPLSRVDCLAEDDAFSTTIRGKT